VTSSRRKSRDLSQQIGHYRSDAPLLMLGDSPGTLEHVIVDRQRRSHGSVVSHHASPITHHASTIVDLASGADDP